MLLGARFGGLHARDLRGIELSLRAQMRHHILGAIRRAGGLIVRALARDELLECLYRFAVLLGRRAGRGQYRNLPLLVDAHPGLPQPMNRKVCLLARDQKVHRTGQGAKDLRRVRAAEIIGYLRKLGADKPLAHNKLLPVCGSARAYQRCDSRVMQSM